MARCILTARHLRWLSIGLLLLVLVTSAACGRATVRPAATPSPTLDLADLSVYVGTGGLCPGLSHCKANAHTGGDRILALNAQTGATRWLYGNITDLPFSSPPVVADGAAYAATWKREVVALATGDGAVRWRTPVPGFVITRPLLADGLLFVTTTSGNTRDDTTDRGGLVVLDAATGAARWSFLPDNRYYSYSPAWTMSQGVIYLNMLDGHVTARRATDGATLWRTAQDDGAPVAVMGDTVLSLVGVGTPSLTQPVAVVAFSARDGALRWQSDPLSIPVRAIGPTVEAMDSTVAVNAGGRLTVLDPATGKERWHYPATASADALFLSEGINGVTVAGGVLYAGIRDGSFAAFDAVTGAQRWHSACVLGSVFGSSWPADCVPQNSGGGPINPIVLGDTLFTRFAYDGDGEGAVIAIDTRTGALRWSAPLVGAILPQLSGGA